MDKIIMMKKFNMSLIVMMIKFLKMQYQHKIIEINKKMDSNRKWIKTTNRRYQLKIQFIKESLVLDSFQVFKNNTNPLHHHLKHLYPILTKTRVILLMKMDVRLQTKQLRISPFLLAKICSLNFKVNISISEIIKNCQPINKNNHNFLHKYFTAVKHNVPIKKNCCKPRKKVEL